MQPEISFPGRITAKSRSGRILQLEILPDEEPGQLNLWWPLSVPYVDENGNRPERPTPPPPSTLDPNEGYECPTYGKTLKNDEFRVAVLSAAEKKEHPIHVTLEVYEDDCHPEYETVSYVWGGEDGDNTLCSPVFIGVWWDVSIHTRNCMSMLRFMRPWRGIRTLWVDALCINQRNPTERTAQVAKMGIIYRGCLRVIVYLGDDIATSSTMFPTRRPFNDIGKASPIFPEGHELHNKPFTLRDLLQRRYFKRVWVIQELIYAERAMIKVGNVEYRADARIIEKMSSESIDSDNKFPAHWMRNLGQGNISLGNTTISHLLTHTGTSEASDMRDKLFGIISLVSEEQLRIAFPPDYSISYLQFCIGTLAHMLLEEKYTSVIYRARTVNEEETNTSSRLSSWFQFPITIDVETSIESKNCQPYGLHPSWPTDLTLNGYAPTYLMGGTYPGYGYKHKKPFWLKKAQVSSQTGSLTLTLIHMFRLEQKPCPRGNWEGYHIFTVNSDTGKKRADSELGLISRKRLDLIVLPGRDHIFMLSPTCESRYWGFKYVIVGSPMPVPIYLLLREVSFNSTHTRKYRLVASDPFLFLSSNEELHEGLLWRHMALNSVGRTVGHYMEDLRGAFEDIYIEGYAKRRMLRYEITIANLPRHFLRLGWQQLFPTMVEWIPSATMCIDLIKQVYSKLEKSGESCFSWSVYGHVPDSLKEIVSEEVERWMHSKALTINQHHQAKIKDDFFTMKFDRTQWKEGIYEFYLASRLHLPETQRDKVNEVNSTQGYLRDSIYCLGWEFRNENSSSWHIFDSNFPERIKQVLSGTSTVHVRAPTGRFLPFLTDEVRSFLRPLLNINTVYERVLDTETMMGILFDLSPLSASKDPTVDLDGWLAMILREPTEEQHAKAIPTMLGDVRVDGGEWVVEIV